MPHNDKNLLDCVYKNAKTAAFSMECFYEKVKDASFKTELSSQCNRYKSIAREAGVELAMTGRLAQDRGVVHNTLFKAGVRLGANDPSYVAKTLITGATSSVIDVTQTLRNSQRSGDRAEGLARNLLLLEQDGIESLKRFL